MTKTAILYDGTIVAFPDTALIGGASVTPPAFWAVDLVPDEAILGDIWDGEFLTEGSPLGLSNDDKLLIQYLKLSIVDANFDVRISALEV